MNRHRNPLKLLTIVTPPDHPEHWGVVIGYDALRRRYHVRLVSVTDDGYGDMRYAADGDVWYRRDEIAGLGFCENDPHPQWILTAAAGYGAHWNGGYVNAEPTR